VYGDTSWDISQMGQYVKAKRDVKSQAWRFLQDMVKLGFFLLLFSRGRD